MVMIMMLLKNDKTSGTSHARVMGDKEGTGFGSLSGGGEKDQ